MDLDDLTHGQAALSAVLAGLAPDDWGLPTPCEGWSVEDVVRHLLAGDRAFVTSLGGTTYDLQAITAGVAAIATADLPAAYGEGAVTLRAALTDADPTEVYPTGIGPMTVPAVAELRIIETLTHGWDVARGVDVPLGVDDAVADRAQTHSLALMERLPPERTPFGPAQPVADDAAAIDRLAALLGRSVSG